MIKTLNSSFIVVYKKISPQKHKIRRHCKKKIGGLSSSEINTLKFHASMKS